MAIPIVSKMTESTAAYTKSDNYIKNRWLNLPKGRITILGKAVSAGMQMQFVVGGVPLMDDVDIPFLGATGGLTSKDHVIMDQMVQGGTAEFYLRNTTAAAITTDFTIYYSP